MAKRRGHGEGSISFDAQRGRWIGRAPRDERGRRQKVVGGSRREVQQKLRRLLDEREQGVESAGRMTVGTFLESWVRDSLPLSNRSSRTIESYAAAVRLHLAAGSRPGPAGGAVSRTRATVPSRRARGRQGSAHGAERACRAACRAGAGDLVGSRATQRRNARAVPPAGRRRRAARSRPRSRRASSTAAREGPALPGARRGTGDRSAAVRAAWVALGGRRPRRAGPARPGAARPPIDDAWNH